MPLDLEPLKKALDVLKRSLAVAHSEERMARLDEETREVVRMGGGSGL